MIFDITFCLIFVLLSIALLIYSFSQNEIVKKNTTFPLILLHIGVLTMFPLLLRYSSLLSVILSNSNKSLVYLVCLVMNFISGYHLGKGVGALIRTRNNERFLNVLNKGYLTLADVFKYCLLYFLGNYTASLELNDNQGVVVFSLFLIILIIYYAFFAVVKYNKNKLLVEEN